MDPFAYYIFKNNEISVKDWLKSTKLISQAISSGYVVTQKDSTA